VLKTEFVISWAVLCSVVVDTKVSDDRASSIFRVEVRGDDKVDMDIDFFFLHHSS